MITGRLGFLTVAIAVAAITAAGCGSSSKSKTANHAESAPSPATPSTGTGTAPASGLTGSSSMPISSPIVRAALLTKIAQQPSFPRPKDGPWADCVIKQLQADGLKTVGDAQQRQDLVKTAGSDCAKKVVLGQH